MDQNWEKVHYQQDVKTVKKINKQNKSSNNYLMLGVIGFLAALSSLEDVIKTVCKTGKAMVKASQPFSAAQLFADVRMSSVILIVVLALIGLFFLFRAMFKWDEAEQLSATRFFWNPDEEETEFINQRFDNDFVRRILSYISSTGTESLEVGCKDVKINSDKGTDVFNFRQYGYSSLTNYGSKQLAYYLASHSFPEGFMIYQTKIAPAGANRYVGGVTDVGGEEEQQPEIEEKKRYEAMLNWLAGKLQGIMKMMKLRVSFKMPKPKAGPSPADSGQIVINKGYRPDKETGQPL